MAVQFETWITARMARHAAEEAERTSPLAVAYTALETLRDALAHLSAEERGEVVLLVGQAVGEACDQRREG